MLEIEMPFLSYWLCYFLCRWSDSGCTCAFRCPERLSTDRNDSLCLPLNVSLTSTRVDGRYCPVLSLSWRTTTSPPLQSSGPSPQHYWPRFSLWSLSASATLSLLPQHESMSMALATSILIVVWQMLTDLSRVRKYRRLKPFLFITVVIMVNVYSTLNFRGPPPPFFFSREWSTSLLLWPGWGSTCTTGPDSNGLLLFYPIKLRSQFVRFIVWKFSLCLKCIFLNLLSS